MGITARCCPTTFVPPCRGWEVADQPVDLHEGPRDRAGARHQGVSERLVLPGHGLRRLGEADAVSPRTDEGPPPEGRPWGDRPVTSPITGAWSRPWSARCARR